MNTSLEQPDILPFDSNIQFLDDSVDFENHQQIDFFVPIMNNELSDEDPTFLRPLSPVGSDVASSGSYTDWSSLLSYDDDSQFVPLPLSSEAELQSCRIPSDEPSENPSIISLPHTRPQALSIPVSPTGTLALSADGSRKATPRRLAHNRIEKRYRENLSKSFTALEHTLQPYYKRSSLPESCYRKQASRKMAILADAANYIEELQEETTMLRKKMHSLRQTLLPHGIWKYTMRD